MSTKNIIKIKANGYLYPVTTWVESGRRFFTFPFNRTIKDEIKSLEGSKWHSDREDKAWSCIESHRNNFQLDYLQGKPVYAKYDAPLIEERLPESRQHLIKGLTKFYKHQRNGAAHILQRRQCGVAGEMGTGKSLMLLLGMEIGVSEFANRTKEYKLPIWYVGPKSALYSVQRDFRLWKSELQLEWFTYERLRETMKKWPKGLKAPFFVGFDEISKCKNWMSQRTQAARTLADGIRSDWGEDGYIVGLTGTPAPKSPADWWALAEILCPGFLKEGDIHKFKRRLAVIQQKEGIDGGSYPQLITWRDNEKKCNLCGQFEEHENHLVELVGDGRHPFVPSVNEVALLAKRLKGLFVVYFKKDCLDLPEKQFRIIEVKPKPSTLRAASLILKTALTTIQGLTQLRELSDGFQYIEKSTGTAICSLCEGSKVYLQPEEVPDSCPNCRNSERVRDSGFDISKACGRHTPTIIYKEQRCPTCGGKGVVPTFERTTEVVPCPKDDAFEDLLDEFEDVGRIVSFGGFSGTIDRIVGLCQRHGWHVIRMDQSKITITAPSGDRLKIDDFQSMFQDQQEQFEKVAFVAHPKSGGMGLTLTASPVAIYFSNDFDGEARIQSMDRIHRPGMDLNRGATIIDIIHLPSDRKVLENLEKKRDLQAMSLGDFYENIVAEGDRPK